MNKISIIMGLWKEGYFSESEVVAWADNEILKNKGDLDDSLIELSLKGPMLCSKLPSYIFPGPRKFNFSERFSIRLEKLNWNSEQSVNEFIDWASRAAMGEDLNIPEVLFGYCLDEEFCYDGGNPLGFFNEEISKYKEKSKNVFKGIIAQLNA
jgi:hypothetical protein